MKTKNRIIILSTLILLSALLNITGLSTFSTNDDVYMLLFSSGKYLGEFNPNLIFSNIIYGNCLVFLYKTFPNIEWYSLIMYLIIVSCYYFLFTNFHQKNKWIIILISVLFIENLFNIQFTKASALLAFTGYLLYFKQRNNALLLIVLLSSLIRFETFILVSLLIIPIYFIKEFKVKEVFKFLGVFIISLLLFNVHYQYNNSDKWINYNEYNKLRGEVYDNIQVKKYMPEYGVSYEDFNLIFASIPNTKVINTETLSNIKNSQQKSKNSFQFIFNSILTNLFFYIAILIFIIEIYKINVWSKLVSLIIVSTLFYINYKYMIKYRVEFIYFIFIPISYYFLKIKPKPILLFIIIISTAYFTINKSLITDTKYTEQQNLIEDYENYLTYPTGILNIKNENPFSISKSFDPQIVTLGWLTNHPINNKVFKDYSFFIEGNGLLINHNQENLIPFIEKSILDNHYVTVEGIQKLTTENYQIIEFH